MRIRSRSLLSSRLMLRSRAETAQRRRRPGPDELLVVAGEEVAARRCRRVTMCNDPSSKSLEDSS